jgi:tetratricopeptide (TPR) repeat protein
MELIELRRAHRFDELVKACQQRLALDAADMEAAGHLATAFKALGRYAEALPYYALLDEDEKSTSVAEGLPGRQKDIACLHWMLGDRITGMNLMAGLVDGILGGSINYGDIDGGVSQGLLLHYMGITAGDEAVQAKALSFLRDRAKRSAAKTFPGPVARYYLDEIDLPELLAAATSKQGAVRDPGGAIEAARGDLLTRRFVCVALFHDGAKARGMGNQAHCMRRMEECFALPNPLIEQEWYLARFEIERNNARGRM